MGFDAQLPTIETQLEKYAFEPVDIPLTELTEQDFTIAYIPDPPTVEVKKGHLIEAINSVELDSLLVEVNEDNNTVTLFYVSEDATQAYQATYNEGIKALTMALFAEDWFVIELNKNCIPNQLVDLFEEMKVLKNGHANEGELFSETYAINQLKTRIIDMKESEEELFPIEDEVEN